MAYTEPISEQASDHDYVFVHKDGDHEQRDYNEQRDEIERVTEGKRTEDGVADHSIDLPPTLQVMAKHGEHPPIRMVVRNGFSNQRLLYGRKCMGIWTCGIYSNATRAFGQHKRSSGQSGIVVVQGSLEDVD